MVTPLFTVGLPLPACLLPGKLLARHSERILSHRVYVLRQAVFLLRLSAGMCWGADEHVRATFALAPYPADRDVPPVMSHISFRPRGDYVQLDADFVVVGSGAGGGAPRRSRSHDGARKWCWSRRGRGAIPPTTP